MGISIVEGHESNEIKGRDHKWFFKLYKEDKRKVLKNMSLHVFDKILRIKTFLLIGFFITYGVTHYKSEGDIISVSFGIISLIQFISYFLSIFMLYFIDLYISNSRAFKKWNYGKNLDNEKHDLIGTTRPGNREDPMDTEWMDVTNYPEPSDNIVKFVGLDLTKYNLSKKREDSINELLK